MSTLRDRTLAKINHARTFPPKFGLHRFAVTLRRRIWSGAFAGDGALTLQDISIVPVPHVQALPSTERQQIDILVSGSYATFRTYKLRVTPQGVDRLGNVIGYTAQQVDMRVKPETPNVDPVVILIGDDGFARECVQVYLSTDRPFRYEMIVQETDRKAAMIVDLVIAPSSVSLSALVPNVQLAATGTFEDTSTCDVTPIVSWATSDPTVATVDLLGSVTRVAAGTAKITAFFRGFQSNQATITCS